MTASGTATSITLTLAHLKRVSHKASDFICTLGVSTSVTLSFYRCANVAPQSLEIVLMMETIFKHVSDPHIDIINHQDWYQYWSDILLGTAMEAAESEFTWWLLKYFELNCKVLSINQFAIILICIQTYLNLSVLRWTRVSAGLNDTAPQLLRILNYNVALMHSTVLSSSCTLNGHKTELCTFFLV